MGVPLYKESKNSASLPRLWYKALLAKQDELEKKRAAVLQQVQEALTSLSRHYHWDEAYIFGSVVKKGRFQSHSDIDIAVRGLNRFEYYAFIGEISERLNKRVDVVLFEECHFIDSIITKGLKWNRKAGL